MTQLQMPLGKILIECETFKPDDLAMIEEKKNAKFVCETCLRSSDGGWVNSMVAVFWNKDPANIPAGGSAWFGMFFRPASGSWLTEKENVKPDYRLYITNAVSTVIDKIGVPLIIKGIRANNGDIIYSHYRHDYRGSPDGSVWIDGGRDYTRTGWAEVPNGDSRIVDLQIIEGDLVQVA